MAAIWSQMAWRSAPVAMRERALNTSFATCTLHSAAWRGCEHQRGCLGVAALGGDDGVATVVRLRYSKGITDSPPYLAPMVVNSRVGSGPGCGKGRIPQMAGGAVLQIFFTVLGNPARVAGFTYRSLMARGPPVICRVPRPRSPHCPVSSHDQLSRHIESAGGLPLE